MTPGDSDTSSSMTFSAYSVCYMPGMGDITCDHGQRNLYVNGRLATDAEDIQIRGYIAKLVKKLQELQGGAQ